MKNTLLLLIILVGFTSCKKDEVRLATYAFEDCYNEREDFDEFLEMYAEDVVLEDMIFGWKIEGKRQLKLFFNWPDSRFEKIDKDVYQVDERIISGRKAILSGKFGEFKWDSTEVEAMNFTTILHFNKEMKIIKQVDWINYPSYLVDYDDRSNSNKW